MLKRVLSIRIIVQNAPPRKLKKKFTMSGDRGKAQFSHELAAYTLKTNEIVGDDERLGVRR